ncbi:MAG: proline dehydrogenase family protein [Bdellovibrionota bacterium]
MKKATQNDVPMEKELNLSNTEIAFKHLSDHALYKTYLLFASISRQTLVAFVSKLLLLALRLKLPVKLIVKHTMFKQFCGGETIEECQNLVSKLAKFNIGGIIDYSVEGKKNEPSFDQAYHEIKKTIEFSSKNMKPAYAAFKVSALGDENLLKKVQDLTLEGLSLKEKEAYNRIIKRMHNLGITAQKRGVRLMVDAEDYAFQSAIDHITEELMREFNRETAVIYNTIQLYRKDRLGYLKRLHQDSLKKGYFVGIKAVRGAYLEKEKLRAKVHNYPDPIQDTKLATDSAFNMCLEYCIEHIEKIWLFSGSHNENSTFLLTQLMHKAGLKTNDHRVAFSQLYGMGDNLSYNLAHHGYHVRKYIPYGPVKEVMPYLIRRAEENTSIQGQTNRELALLKSEIQRRKFFSK